MIFKRLAISLLVVLMPLIISFGILAVTGFGCDDTPSLADLTSNPGHGHGCN